MEKKIRSILELLDSKIISLDYRGDKKNIRLNELLREYENGLTFIDYLYDIYYLKEFYSYLHSDKYDKYEEYKKSIKDLKTYYHTLLIFKFIFTEIQKSLEKLEDCNKAPLVYREFVMGKKFEYIEPRDTRRLEVTFGVDSPNFLKDLIDAIRVSPDGLVKLALLDILIYEIFRKEYIKKISSFDQFLEDLESNLQDMLDEFENLVNINTGHQMNKSSLNTIYYIHPEKLEWFAKYIDNDQLVKEIEKLSKSQKDKLSCCALVIFGESKYYTINGLDGEGFKLLKMFFVKSFNEEFTYVDISDGVRYFLSDKIEYITYKQFVNNEKKHRENRMFTCCERKLFAEIRRQKKFKNDIQIIITNSPCVYCSREIDYIEKNYANKIEITQPEEGTDIKTPDDSIVKLHDDIAEKIWRNNN